MSRSNRRSNTSHRFGLGHVLAGWVVAVVLAVVFSWDPTTRMLARYDGEYSEEQCRSQYQKDNADKEAAAVAKNQKPPQGKEQADPEKAAREYCVQRRAAIAGERQGDIALGAAFVSFFALAAAVGAVMAAGFAAVRARETVDTMQDTAKRQLRAYVNFDGMQWSSESDHDGLWWRMRARWINTGSTPTRDLTVNGDVCTGVEQISEDFDFTIPEARKIPAMIRPHSGRIEGRPFRISAEELALVQRGIRHLFVWGVVKYGDVFEGTPSHVTRFCCYAASITGDPMKPFDEKANPVNIVFLHWYKHNCVDEDCATQDASPSSQP